MSLKAMILIVIIAVAALILNFINRLGGFKTIEVSEAEAGPFYTVSKAHLGAYHKIVPVIEEVETWVRARGDRCKYSFGEFIDNVDTVPEDRLHSYAGCLVTKEFYNGFSSHQGDAPAAFEFREIAKRRYVQADFDGAPSIGPMKVYPKLLDYMTAKNLKRSGAVIETYELLANQGIRTHYYFPVQ